MTVRDSRESGGSDETRAAHGRVPALLVMHSDLAEAMVRAAERVVGPVEGLDVLSNSGLSREDLEARIDERVTGWVHGGLVLTDFWGGSCHTCGASAARGKAVIVITGCNLSMLIDYVHNRDKYSTRDLAERLLAKGQQSIRLQHGASA
jgi:mannose/fructose-specific phosphotransferase system component IIA